MSVPDYQSLMLPVLRAAAAGEVKVSAVVERLADELEPNEEDRVYVQAKRYQPGNTVGSGQVRDFFGSLDTFKAGKGVFLTTSTFSGSAKRTANSLSK